MKTICVVGLGYIGLPTASMLAVKGYDVHGMDIRRDVVDALNSGRILIKEPGLDIMVKSAVKSGQLKAHSAPVEADVFILALPTPFLEDKRPDLSFVRSGVEEIAPLLRPGNFVILESTSPVGTTEKICAWIHELRPDLKLPLFAGGEGEQLYLAHCPERVLPGRILTELVQNDRIVGGIDAISTARIAEFYGSFVEGDVLRTDAQVAEFSKLIENSYRDVNIAFANELSLICAELGINAWEAIALANRHPRVNILKPGAGVGGHCISVDPWFLVHAAPERARLIRAAREANDGKALWVRDHIRARAARFKNPQIACFGLAFKPDVDDLRESPAMRIVADLAENADWNLAVVEPNIAELPPALASLANVRLCSAAEALKACDIAVFLVAHKQFQAIAPDSLYEKIVIDPCGLFQTKN